MLAVASSWPVNAADVPAARIVESGEPMPATTTAERFRDFTSFGLAGGTAAFIGLGRPLNAPADTRRGVYTRGLPPAVGAPAPPAVVADNTTPVPGGAGNFSVFDSVSTANGRVAFTVENRGAYTNVAGALMKLADTGDNAPGRTERFNNFQSPSLAVGKTAFIGRSNDPTAFPFNRAAAFQAVYTNVPGAVTVVAQKGTAVPGAGAARFNKFGSVALDAGKVVFDGGNDSVDFAPPTPAVRGVYSNRTGALARVADTTTTIPMTPGNPLFGDFLSPQLSQGSVAFIGYQPRVGNVPQSGRQGIYTDLSGALTKVVDTMTPLPDDATKTFNTIRGLSFSRGNFAIWAGPDAVNTRIYASAGGAAPVRIVGPGDMVLGKMVTSVSMLRESLNGNQILFSASFADGSRGLYVTTVMALPVQVNVCVNFAGSGVTGTAAMAGFIGQIQAYYDNAGIGTGNSPRVIVSDAATTPAARCDINASFISPAVANYWGNSDKRAHNAFVNTTLFGAQFPGAGMAARRQQGMAETMAHEVGHTLCAVHDCRNGGGLKATVAVPAGAACPGAARTATLMTVGTCVANANRGFAPGNAGSRALSATSIDQIKSGIKMLVAKAPNWALVAAFDVNVLRLIEGKAHLGPLGFGGESFFQEEPDVDFTYDVLQGDQALFEFGWLNESNEFIEPLPPEENPDRVLEESGGTFLHFALRGLPGTAFEGQVFSQKDFGALTFSGQFNSPSEAATPGVTGPYSSAVTIDFNVAGNVFSVRLDTGEFGSRNGFAASTANDCAPDVTPQVTITRLGYRFNRATGRYLQEVDVLNSGDTLIPAPISLVLDSLSTNAALFNKTGMTVCAPPLGSPFINATIAPGDSLNPGQRILLVLEFTNPPATSINYQTRVLAGQGAR